METQRAPTMGMLSLTLNTHRNNILFVFPEEDIADVGVLLLASGGSIRNIDPATKVSLKKGKAIYSGLHSGGDVKKANIVQNGADIVSVEYNVDTLHPFLTPSGREYELGFALAEHLYEHAFVSMPIDQKFQVLRRRPIFEESNQARLNAAVKRYGELQR